MPGGQTQVTKTVGRYEILREIGRGGMATVYLARQIDLDRRVALKELGALRAEDPSFVKRFLREAQLAGSLSHANVVTVHDYFEYEGVPYIAMEYVPGGSVRPWVGRMSPAKIGGVLRDVLAGLGAGFGAGWGVGCGAVGTGAGAVGGAGGGASSSSPALANGTAAIASATSATTVSDRNR